LFKQQNTKSNSDETTQGIHLGGRICHIGGSMTSKEHWCHDKHDIMIQERKTMAERSWPNHHGPGTKLCPVPTMTHALQHTLHATVGHLKEVTIGCIDITNSI
jgi:hypothetical protein